MKNETAMKIKIFLRDSLLVFTAVLLAVLAVISIHLQVGVITITSNSMSPTFKAGDTALTTQVSREAIREGDVLVLPHPSDPATYFAHRVIGLSRLDNRVLVETQGDANPIKDNWALEVRSEEIPRVSFALSTSHLPFDLSQRRLISQVMLGVALFAIAMGARRSRIKTR